jgi:hypothetical protein
MSPCGRPAPRLPGKALPADADAVADGRLVLPDEVEHALVDIDDDGAGRLTARIAHRLPREFRLQQGPVDERDVEGLVRHRADEPAVVIGFRHGRRDFGRSHRAAGGERGPGQDGEQGASGFERVGFRCEHG